METDKVIVARIRPVSWKVCVTGVDGADHVRSALRQFGMDCSDAVREPDLQQEPMFSFIATSRQETPLTALELQAIFEQDDKIEVAFDS